MMAVAYRPLDTAAMYVAIVVTSVIGYVLDRSFLFARGRLLTWA
jgi:ABC-type nitrate/sulfonate/bicarbonate transport system permease component